MSIIFVKKPVTAPIIFAAPSPKLEKQLAETPSLAKLLPGQSLSPGESLVSANGRYKFGLSSQDVGSDLIVDDANNSANPFASGLFGGNALLVSPGTPYALWSAYIRNQDAARLLMQSDGNLVVLDVNARSIWSSATGGHPGAYAVIEDDGNASVYLQGVKLWTNGTWVGWRRVKEEKTWLGEALDTAGRTLADAAKGVAKGFEDVGDALGSIPIVGPLLHGVLTIAAGPFNFTESVIEGERIDKALIKDLTDKITAVREIAPYAQTVLSFVPGIGTGVAAAIGAGLALAQGRPIDEAVLEGVKGALPGGAASRAAFSLTVAAVNGENVIQAAGDAGIDAIGLPPDQAQALHKALTVVYQAAQGENIPLAILKQARSYLPTPETQKAFDIGLALAQGKRLQDVTVEELKNLSQDQKEKIAGVGIDLINQTPALQAARNAVSAGSGMIGQAARGASQSMIGQAVQTQTAKDGFEFGIGVMRHGGVNEDSFNVLRNHLTPTEQSGFDVAVATYKAAVKTRTAANASPEEKAGYLTAKGMAGNPNPQTKVESLKFYLVDPGARKGVSYAIAQVQSKRLGFFGWLLGLVGL